MPADLDYWQLGCYVVLVVMIVAAIVQCVRSGD